MCGIAGFLSHREAVEEDLLRIAENMADRLRHRGPDDAGAWADAGAGIALGHRRLAILDLSPEGRQPMVSRSGRWVLTYNGEVYNYRRLREDLPDVPWRGSSDTEVVLAAVDRWGLEPAVDRFVGMFAMAIWDRSERRLHLVRDRLGIKPVYYGRCGRTFLFGSELKALRAHPAFDAEIDRSALTGLLRYNYVPAPHTIFAGIRKLRPGHILTVSANGFVGDDSECERPYWSARHVIERAKADPLRISESEAEQQLDALLSDVVRCRMVSDVPLGALLSGGIDSSAVVAQMQRHSSRPVRTFSVGFRESGYNEAHDAKNVADHLKTEHTELYVDPAEALAVIPELPRLYDEPFADASQIPTYLVSRLARQHVTVALSGDGGDEVFGGYNRYFWGRSIWNRIEHLPMAVRGAMKSGMTALSPRTWDAIFERLGPVLPRKLRQRIPGDRLHKLSNAVMAASPEEMYLQLASHWDDPEDIVVGGREPACAATDRAGMPSLEDFTERMMYLDLVSYLPDDILTKVDRASMGVGLELRVPLLDHRLVEFAWRLPLAMKIADGEGKRILRKVLYRYVPPALVERPKMGFGIPLDEWLRGPLREWAEAQIDPLRLRREGFLESDLVHREWNRHLSGVTNRQYNLWGVLTFQSWLEGQDDGVGLR